MHSNSKNAAYIHNFPLSKENTKNLENPAPTPSTSYLIEVLSDDDTKPISVSTLFVTTLKNFEWNFWQRVVENSSRFTNVAGDSLAENSGNWYYVVGE